jgi:hypothetical protein
MKTSFVAVSLLALLVLGAREVWAQGYGPYYYDPYWDEIQYQQYLQYLQQYDPYYELHVMHYRLYLPQYQPYQIYQPCCYAWGVAIPQWSTPGARRQPVISPRPQAVGRLPQAVSPLPQATARR